jgi:Tol biopolymer transport system component
MKITSWITNIVHIFTTTILENNTPVQLTTHKDGATKPAWSPDGKQIAFTDLLKKKNQIFILSMEGEPIQLTKDKYGASNLNGPQMAKNTVFIQHTITRFTARLY